ncbi:ribosome-associated translation inhibitor RaiA [Actinocorallia sp. API 0066]|uniref:ribosome hibernation-promoting factor, HPF/YfiA family n=1 Tax=Actinocorallia sp. API 0066 TaxID=2896846 RepID=UPI001E5ECD15|nr:ribosome-associated translation inhibitor RaiA [Actinocorallia sp. API 0066]MCD0451210.1 ribosome-associated translation inhibitor RaiA [Actinocorallia sp. API 0066]
MDIIVKGRRTDVNDRFKRHIDTKLAKLERLDSKIIRVDVEVSSERNPRMADQRERVELTLHSKGPVIRAEAAADDRYGALDMALDKLDSRLRRMADRRKGHHMREGEAIKASGIEMPSTLPPTPTPRPARAPEPARAATGVAVTERQPDGYERPDLDEELLPIAKDGNCPVVVREKAHKAGPMDIDQALYEMELVGHDFFLFSDKESGLPSVVYRRRGWDYGVIRLIDE